MCDPLLLFNPRLGALSHRCLVFPGDCGAVLVRVGCGSLGDNGVVLCGLWVYQLYHCLIFMVWGFRPWLSWSTSDFLVVNLCV